MVRTAWKLRREGGGVKVDEEGVGRTFTYLFFHFSFVWLPPRSWRRWTAPRLDGTRAVGKIGIASAFVHFAFWLRLLLLLDITGCNARAPGIEHVVSRTLGKPGSQSITHDHLLLRLNLISSSSSSSSMVTGSRLVAAGRLCFALLAAGPSCCSEAAAAGLFPAARL
jgi:hypothetical protein